VLLVGVLLAACGQDFEHPQLPAEGGAAGAGASRANAGATAAGGASASTGGWVSPVAPEISQRWSWSECGRINPDAVGEHYLGTVIDSLAISEDGSLLLSNISGLVVGWRVGEPFEASQPLWTTSTEGGSNVALSPDGRFGTVSGDLRHVFDTTTGDTIFTGITGVPGSNVTCIGSEYNFSPDGRLLAGKLWSPVVDVFETETFSLIGQFRTVGCAQGIAFSADSKRIVAPDGSASVEGLLPSVMPGSVLDGSHRRWTSLTRAPDGSFVEVTCYPNSCQGRWIDISDEGHWHLQAGTLRHVPSGEERVFDSLAREAVFAPNGDIIAGEDGPSLVKFCRSE
jgi:hypothetical protein